MRSSGLTQRQPAARKKAADREAAAVRLWVTGMSLSQIADRVGYKGATGAKTAIDRALRRIPDEAADEARRKMAMQLAELELATFRIMTNPNPLTDKGKAITVEQRAADGTVTRVGLVDQNAQLKAVQTFVRVQESQRKLLGLDAASKFELTGDGGSAIEVSIREELTKAVLAKVRNLRPITLAEVSADASLPEERHDRTPNREAFDE